MAGSGGDEAESAILNLPSSSDTRHPARLLGAGATIVDSAGMTREPAERDRRERAVASSKAALGEDAWSLEFERGRGFSPREALECALGQT